MSPIKLDPLERIQLQALVGALGAGLQASDASSIFGGVTDEITSRQAQERAARAAQLKALMDQQQAEQEARTKGILSLNDLIASAAGKTSTTTTQHVMPDGTIVPTTSTTTSGSIPFPQLQSEIGAIGSTIPGLTKQDLGAFGSMADLMYQAPTLKPGQAKKFNIGRGLQGNKDVDPFWRDVRNNTFSGIAKGLPPEQIAKTILDAAAAQGYGSPDEQKAIATEIASMMQARGYTAAPAAGGGPAAGAAQQAPQGAVGAAGGAIDPAAVVLGVGAIRGLVKAPGAALRAAQGAAVPPGGYVPSVGVGAAEPGAATAAAAPEGGLLGRILGKLAPAATAYELGTIPSAPVATAAPDQQQAIVQTITQAVQAGTISAADLVAAGKLIQLGGNWQPGDQPMPPAVDALVTKLTSQGVPVDSIYATITAIAAQAAGG